MSLTAYDVTNRGVGDHIAAFFFEAPPLPFVLPPNMSGEPGPVPAPFNRWSRTPRALAITVIVPPERWMGLKTLADARADQSRKPALEIFGHLSSNNVHGYQGRITTVYSDIQISFGTLTTEGSRDQLEFAVHVQEDEGSRNGRSPMIISYHVPTDFIQAFFSHGLVGFITTRISTGKDRLQHATEAPKCDFERRISDETCVFITKDRPRQTCQGVKEESLRAIIDIRSLIGEAPSNIKFTASLAEVKDLITITGHIDITSANGKRLLVDRAPVHIEESTPFTLNVVIGSKTEGITIPLTFPAPVLRKDSRTRIARKSAYIEVIVAPAKHSTNPEILDTFFLPTTKHIPGQPPATLNTPHLNLDRLPIPSLTDKSRARFLTTLTSLMFSPRELLQRSQNQPTAAAPGNNADKNNSSATTTPSAKLSSPPSARLNLKDSLHAIFTLVSTPPQQGGGGSPPRAAQLFTLSLPSSGAHLLLFISALRLDAAHGSVVLDAAVVPFTKALVEGEGGSGGGSGGGGGGGGGDGGPLTPFLRTLAGTPSYALTLAPAELALWKRALPALAERCRTWMHRPGRCEYEMGGGKVPISLEEGEPVLCGCGCGELPDGFVDFPGWGLVKGYATRVAISPVFVSGMVEEVVEPEVARGMARGRARGMAEERSANSGGVGGGDVKRCRVCGKLGTVEGVVLKKCTRCLEVVYCSVGCQKKDWKRHRVEGAAPGVQGQK